MGQIKMSEFRVLSIDLTALGEFVRNNPNHSAITKVESTGKRYLSVLIGDKDAPDQYGNDCSIRINPKKDAADASTKVYLGNGRIFGRNGQSAKPAQPTPTYNAASEADLPF